MPDETPAVPLQRDLARPAAPAAPDSPRAEIKPLDLDLRKETDRARSHLLHRLTLLGIPWGMPQQAQRQDAAPSMSSGSCSGIPSSRSTDRGQRLGQHRRDRRHRRHAPRCPRGAASCPRSPRCSTARSWPRCPDAVDYVLGCLGAEAAVAADLRHLMDALPPLARVARYGDVRETRPRTSCP